MSISPDPTSDDAFAIALDAEGLKQRSVSGSIVIALSQVARMVVQLGSQIVLARLLFPADFGLLAMVYPVVGFIQIFNDLGFAQAIVQRATLRQERVSALFWVNLGLSIGLAVVVALAAPVAAWVYSEPRVTVVMIALGAMMPFAALGVHPSALLTRQMRFGVLSINEFIATLLGIGVTILGALNGLGFWSLIVGQFFNTITSVVLNWLRCGWRPSRPGFDRSVWADLKFGGGLTGAALATFATTSGDNILIGLTTGPVSLGFYDRSYRLVVQPVGQLIAPVSRVAVPLLARLSDRPELYRKAYLDIFQALFLLTAPIMLICMMNSATMVHVFLGDRWTAAAPVFAWICVGGVTAGVYSSAGWLFISQARTLQMARYLSLAAIINLASFLLGAIGGIVWIAGLAAVVFVLGTTPLVLYGATRMGPVTGRDLISATIPVAVQMTLTFGALLIERQAALAGMTQLVVATLACFAMFVATGFFVKGQRAIARTLLTAIMSRRKPAIS